MCFRDACSCDHLISCKSANVGLGGYVLSLPGMDSQGVSVTSLLLLIKG